MKRQKRQSNHRSYLALACLLWTALLLTVYALAANISGFSVSGLSASYENGTWTSTGTDLDGSAAGTAGGGCSDASSTTSTLTLTNNYDSPAQLTFNYAKPTLAAKGGSVKIDGTNVATAGTFQKELAAKGSITIVIYSGDAGANTSSIKISNISLVENKQITLTFKPSQGGGTYTAGGASVTAETSVTQSATKQVELKATPGSNKKLIGWYSETDGKYISTEATWNTYFNKDMTLYPVFAEKNAPVFEVGVKWHTDLNAAIADSTERNISKITLVANGTLPAGDYTIPNGKTLLIPFDAANTVYTTKPEVVYGSHETPSAYKTLTMANGASITVASGGKLCVPSKLSATGTGDGSWNGTPTGKHGRITMNAGSSITLNSGAGLYCYGYISGSGGVTAASGSTVYECFQIRSWRGGTATSNLAQKKVFPMNQYYVQNIEVPLTLNAGATENVYTSVNASNSAYPASATFIGQGGMFTLSSGSLTKRYDGPYDRLIIDLSGNAALSPMNLDLDLVELNTAEFVLPINSNITVNINSGTTTVNQDLAMLPGSQLSIAKDAALTISKGKNVYVYDQSKWGAYAGTNLKLIPVGYSTVNGTAAKRTNASLVDAKIDVNGTLTVAGALYTTSSGANITSSEKTGKVVLNAAAGRATTTQQATQSGTSMTYVDIPITAAKLLNGDGSYTATAGASDGSTFTYCDEHNQWEWPSTTVRFNANEGTGTMNAQTVARDGTLNANTFTRNGYAYQNWNTEENGTGTTYENQSVVHFKVQAITLYAQWEEAAPALSYNVTISWDKLEFTYTRSTSTTYTWDGEGKKYTGDTSDSGSWSGPIGIGVRNKSSAGDVNAKFHFDAAAGLTGWEPTVKFNGGQANADYTVKVAGSGGMESVPVQPVAAPPDDFTSGQIGTITVTITAAQGG